MNSVWMVEETGTEFGHNPAFLMLFNTKEGALDYLAESSQYTVEKEVKYVEDYNEWMVIHKAENGDMKWTVFYRVREVFVND